jgi:hypothetical protein
MTNTELLDLLREAREWVSCPYAYRQTETCPCTACKTKARIDAALAERQDSAKDVVEWRLNVFSNTLCAYVNGCILRISQGGPDVAWDTTRYGRCSTEAEAEAKSAAIAAARGHSSD